MRMFRHWTVNGPDFFPMPCTCNPISPLEWVLYMGSSVRSAMASPLIHVWMRGPLATIRYLFHSRSLKCLCGLSSAFGVSQPRPVASPYTYPASAPFAPLASISTCGPLTLPPYLSSGLRSCERICTPELSLSWQATSNSSSKLP